MTRTTKNSLPLAGLVAGATLVLTSLGVVVNWAVEDDDGNGGGRGGK